MITDAEWWGTPDKYEMVDPQMMAWGERHGLRIQKWDKDCSVRTTWLDGPGGSAQIWLGSPISAERVEIYAAKLTQQKWTDRLNRVVTLADLEGALEQTLKIALDWVA